VSGLHPEEERKVTYAVIPHSIDESGELPITYKDRWKIPAVLIA